MEEVRYVQSKWLYGFGLIRCLIEELNLSPDMCVLNLGCGFGKTAEYIVRRFGCSITAADILKKVVEKAEERALKGEWKSKANFQVLDRQNLTFKKEAYDAIIVETVTTFVKDKKGAAEAYAQALKPGRRMSILELAWLQNPPRELWKRIGMKFGVEAFFLTDEGWRNLFNGAGLELVKSHAYHLSLLQKGWDDFRYEFFEAFSHLLKTCYTFLRNPTARSITVDFLSLYKEYSKFLGVVAYIYSKPV